MTKPSGRDVNVLLIEGRRRLRHGGHSRIAEPFEQAIRLASEGRDIETLWRIAAEAEGLADEMRHSGNPQTMLALDKVTVMARNHARHLEDARDASEKARVVRKIDRSNGSGEHSSEAAPSPIAPDGARGDHAPHAASRAEAPSAEATTINEPRADRASGSTVIDPAQAIARERYARGEITRDEFLTIRDDLAA
jgi:hypothetical protein